MSYVPKVGDHVRVSRPTNPDQHGQTGVLVEIIDREFGNIRWDNPRPNRWGTTVRENTLYLFRFSLARSAPTTTESAWDEP